MSDATRAKLLTSACYDPGVVGMVEEAMDFDNKNVLCTNGMSEQWVCLLRD